MTSVIFAILFIALLVYHLYKVHQHQTYVTQKETEIDEMIGKIARLEYELSEKTVIKAPKKSRTSKKKISEQY